MRRAATLLFVFVLTLVGCTGLRTLRLLFHTPEECPAPDGTASECPLGAMRSIRTRLLEQDGTLRAEDCEDLEETVCTFTELEEFQFLQRSEATDGIEVLIEGRSEPGCRGLLVVTCDSFGESVIDLTEPADIPIWCDCPRITP